ncbi:hypothetical protein GCM10009602_37060 [Nocardiopsis tropica]
MARTIAAVRTTVAELFLNLRNPEPGGRWLSGAGRAAGGVVVVVLIRRRLP